LTADVNTILTVSAPVVVYSKLNLSSKELELLGELAELLEELEELDINYSFIKLFFSDPLIKENSATSGMLVS
jgi:hypothetical protein